MKKRKALPWPNFGSRGFKHTTREPLAALPHGNVIDPMQFRKTKLLPLSFGWGEGQLVVLASDVKGINVGDIVNQINTFSIPFAMTPLVPKL